MSPLYRYSHPYHASPSPSSSAAIISLRHYQLSMKMFTIYISLYLSHHHRYLRLIGLFSSLFFIVIVVSLSRYPFRHLFSVFSFSLRSLFVVCFVFFVFISCHCCCSSSISHYRSPVFMSPYLIIVTKGKNQSVISPFLPPPLPSPHVPSSHIYFSSSIILFLTISSLLFLLLLPYAPSSHIYFSSCTLFLTTSSHLLLVLPILPLHPISSSHLTSVISLLVASSHSIPQPGRLFANLVSNSTRNRIRSPSVRWSVDGFGPRAVSALTTYLQTFLFFSSFSEFAFLEVSFKFNTRHSKTFSHSSS